jgi:hypothetical protein
MKTTEIAQKVFLILTGFAFVKIASEAFTDPQIIMDYVKVNLGNTDARNSIRAFYGGVNLFFGLFIIYGAFRMKKEALLLVLLYCGGFVTGRIAGIVTDGLPGPFVYNWLVIESICTVISCYFLFRETKLNPAGVV